jgi:hypothetical protein
MKPNKLKCTDLRIGNWVKYEDKLVQVVQLSSLMILCQRDENQFLVNCAPEIFQPIELTEDVLVKLGFEGEMYEFCLLADDFNITVNLIENRVDISFFGNCEAELCIKYNVKYLHQLQNAYYCLTNQEMEVKL